MSFFFQSVLTRSLHFSVLEISCCSIFNEQFCYPLHACSLSIILQLFCLVNTFFKLFSSFFEFFYALFPPIEQALCIGGLNEQKRSCKSIFCTFSYIYIIYMKVQQSDQTKKHIQLYYFSINKTHTVCQNNIRAEKKRACWSVSYQAR